MARSSLGTARSPVAPAHSPSRAARSPLGRAGWALALFSLLCLWPALLQAQDLRVAVMDFTDASDDPAYAALGKGLAAMLVTDLSSVEALTLVERERLAEVQAELALAESGLLDPATAARLGRALGASHLLLGSFTVLGAQMRIDARLVAVAESEVTLAREVTGEREAFFELEKELVQALIEALALTPAARERAALARIHTADFDAFHDFSRGVELFDQARYDDALQALTRAAAADSEFRLAELTLSHYEELISQLQTRAQALSVTRAEQARLERLAEGSAQAALCSRLLAIAGQEGPAHQRERLTALYLLTMAYGGLNRNRGLLNELRGQEDRFAIDRAAEQLGARYLVEARSLWPALPLDFEDRFFMWPEGEDFDGVFARAVERLWEEGRDSADNRTRYLQDSLRYPRVPARLLQLGWTDEVQWRLDMMALAQELPPSDYFVNEQNEAARKELRTVLRLDESTRLWREAAAATEHPRTLESIAEEIAFHRDLSALLQRDPDDPWLRAWLLMALEAARGDRQVLRVGEAILDDAIDERIATDLLRLHDFPANDGYLLIGDAPLRAQQGRGFLYSGLRSDDQRRSEALHYLRRPEREAGDTLVWWSRPPVGDFTLELVLDTERHPLVAPRAAEIPAGAVPGFSILFAAEDLDCALAQDPVTEERILERPLRALELDFASGGVELVDLAETERGRYDRKASLDGPTLDRQNRRGRGLPERIRLERRGQRLTAIIDGQRFVFDLPADRSSGFVGFRWVGEGVLTVRDLSIDAD